MQERPDAPVRGRAGAEWRRARHEGGLELALAFVDERGDEPGPVAESAVHRADAHPVSASHRLQRQRARALRGDDVGCGGEDLLPVGASPSSRTFSHASV